MSGFYLTFILCLLSASSRVLLKKGFANATPTTGTAVSILIGFIFLAMIAIPKIIINFHTLNYQGLLMFLGIGTIAPPLVRFLSYTGIDRIGASRADPLRSTQPIFAIIIGSLLMSELPTWKVWLATFFIIVGTYVLTRPRKGHISKTENKKDYLYPLGAALVAGFIMVARKYSMQFVLDPAIAAFTSASSALVVFGVYLLLTGKKQKIELNKSSMKYLVIAGTLTALTDVLDLFILKISEVKIVAPLLGTIPLFVILLSSIFLKKEEVVSAKTWIGATLIMVGVQFVFYEVKL